MENGYDPTANHENHNRSRVGTPPCEPTGRSLPRVPGQAHLSGSALRELEEVAKEAGAAGLSHIRFRGTGSLDSLGEEDILSSAGLRMPAEWSRRLAQRMGAGPGDLVLMMAGQAKGVNSWLSTMRNYMGKRLDLADPDTLVFAFITQFPLFEWDEDSGRWDSSHHPFTAPADGQEDMLDGAEIGAIKSKAYDLVCNGSELASGSIRIHRRELQEKVFRILGYTKEETGQRFGQILEAFEFGAPPHGGIAPGIDRLVATLAGADSIRDVIAFPKTQSGSDLLFESPASVTEGDRVG